MILLVKHRCFVSNWVFGLHIQFLRKSARTIEGLYDERTVLFKIEDFGISYRPAIEGESQPLL